MPRSIRRVVTGLDAQGRSVWASDEVATTIWGNAKLGTRITEIWRIPRLPPDVHDDHAPRDVQVWPSPGGLVFRMAELPPKSVYRQHPEEIPKGPDGKPVDIDDKNFGLHASDTIDLMVVIEGELWAYQKDSDKGVLLKAGDTFIMRGTKHSWHNRSDKPCLYAVVLVDATGRPKTDGH